MVPGYKKEVTLTDLAQSSLLWPVQKQNLLKQRLSYSHLKQIFKGHREKTVNLIGSVKFFL